MRVIVIFCNLCNVFYLIKSRYFFRYSNILSFGVKKYHNNYYLNENVLIITILLMNIQMLSSFLNDIKKGLYHQ